MNIRKPLLVLLLLLPLVTGFLIMSRDKEVRLEKRVLYHFPVNDRIRLEVLITQETNIIVNLAEKDPRYEDGQLIFNLQYSGSDDLMTAGFVFNRETNRGVSRGITLDFTRGKLSQAFYSLHSETNETIYANRQGDFLPDYVWNRPGASNRRESIRYEFTPLVRTNPPAK